jgi:dGTPase
MIHDLVSTTVENLQNNNISSYEDVRKQTKNLVDLSPQMSELNQQLKEFLYQRLYRHSKVERMRVKAEYFLTRLFKDYINNPTLLPERHQQRFAKYGTERVICDYIASMTDRYVQDEYKRLYEPFERA